MTDFAVAERRANALARRLLKAGGDASEIAAAFAVQAAALSNAATDRTKTSAWLREIADRNEAR
ncbi:hypothetical protein [Mesorhizobium cantuariense]|uniref:Uncharacterized protein n=1 Tax=Mesorhizobium cantuariense TaxID=1300275 RepID=A0ABV7MND4_9HYPH